MVINRVNPAMITYRNMPKSPEKSNDADVKKSSSLMTRSEPTPQQRMMSNKMDDARYRMRALMDHMQKFKEEI